jgi:hypothetical protein
MPNPLFLGLHYIGQIGEVSEHRLQKTTVVSDGSRTSMNYPLGVLQGFLKGELPGVPARVSE